jgi:hypothetical protein
MLNFRLKSEMKRINCRGNKSPNKQTGKVTKKRKKSPSGGDMDIMDIVGLVVLIGGVVIAIRSHQNIMEFQTTGGRLARALSSSQRELYQQHSNRRIAGVALAIIGGAIILID